MPKLLYNESECTDNLSSQLEGINTLLEEAGALPLNPPGEADVGNMPNDVKTKISDAITDTQALVTWLSKVVTNFNAFEIRAKLSSDSLTNFVMSKFGELTALNGNNFDPNKFMSEVEKLLSTKPIAKTANGQTITVDINDVDKSIRATALNNDYHKVKNADGSITYLGVNIDGVYVDIKVPTTASGAMLYFHGANGEQTMASKNGLISTDSIVITPRLSTTGPAGAMSFNVSGDTVTSITNFTNSLAEDVFGKGAGITVGGHSLGVSLVCNQMKTITDTGIKINSVDLVSGPIKANQLTNLPKGTKVNLIYSTADGYTGTATISELYEDAYNKLIAEGYNVEIAEVNNVGHVGMFQEGINAVNAGSIVYDDNITNPTANV